MWENGTMLWIPGHAFEDAAGLIVIYCPKKPSSLDYEDILQWAGMNNNSPTV